MTLAIAAVLGACLVALGARVIVDTTLLEAFTPSDPVHIQTRLLERELDGVLPFEISLAAQTQGRFDDPEVLNAVAEVQAWLETRDGVLSTTSYGDLLHEMWVAWSDDPAMRDTPFRSRAQVAQLASLLESGRPNPIAPYVSFDRRHLRLNIKLSDDGSTAALALADALRDQLTAALGGLDDVTWELTGDAYTGSLGLDSLIRDLTNSLALAIAVIFGIMTLLFRSLRMGLISVPANVLPLLSTWAYMAVRGVPLNTTTAIIFSVSIGLAVDDTVHFLARFGEERREGVDMDTALLRTARGSGRAIVVTSLMLGFGMLVMLLSTFMPVRLFGELLCVTIAACVVGDLAVLPAMLKIWSR